MKRRKMWKDLQSNERSRSKEKHLFLVRIWIGQFLLKRGIFMSARTCHVNASVKQWLKI